jgi:hypothetical protein
LLGQDEDMPSRQSKRDLRWPTAIGLSVFAAALACFTRWLSGDSWREFGVVAAYSIAWALITFSVLYLVGKAFESWEWGREDHDLVKALDESKK